VIKHIWYTLNKQEFRDTICIRYGWEQATINTRLLAALFYLEYGLYFACSSYMQHTQRDKVFAWAIIDFQLPQMPFGNGRK